MSTVLRAASLYFLAVFGAGFVLGVVRALWLVPQVGTRAAELIEMPLMLAVMIYAARRVVGRYSLSPRPRVRLAVGGLASASLLAVELAVVLPMRGVSFGEYWARLDPVSGSVYYALLAVYALLPLLIQIKRWYTAHALGWGSALLAALVLGLGYTGYLMDVERALDRVSHGSRIAATACGMVEYAEKGKGPAVLLVHGAGGGFDQGMEFAELADRGFRVVGVSRFGYLRTPLPSDPSPEAQADAHACLLDALGIDRAAVVGVSAGAPSSIQFALRHPARTHALALLVPLAYSPKRADPPSAFTRFMLERTVRSDFLYWLVLRIAPGVIVKTILATPPEVLAEASLAEQQRAARLMEHILPIRARQLGLLNDAAIAQSLTEYPLERIRTPTLVISLADDLYRTYESAGYTASRIRGSHFIGYERGGHVWIGRHDAILAELAAFLSAPGTAMAARR
jgi:pimeloyl-ACP methyl ester carboxylesterase